MAKNSLFVDVNVLIEILESRPKRKAAQNLMRANAGNLYISTLTCHIVTYVSQKRVGLELLEQFLTDYEWLALLPEDVLWAFDNRRGKDFEDALQIAIAIRNGCDTFITLDQELFRTYGALPTLSVKLLK